MRHGTRLLAIGASAGGPGALQTVFAALPADFPAAVVIVQHVDAQFAPGMAQWLDQSCALPVRTARAGDKPAAGEVLLACTGDHLVLTPMQLLGYTGNPSAAVYRPSVDVFFHSVCAYWTGGAVGLLLTGMGRDGALGLKALRNKGFHTLAQDEGSSAVYGMPKAAAALDAVDEILALESIAPRLSALFARTDI